MKRICVYSGSNTGFKPIYKESAKRLGQEIVNKGLELIYGGSNVGLMGAVANEVLKSQGSVIGVIPRGLFGGEIVHHNLTKMIEVENMRERKKKMFELADGFIALPGGLGTLEELFETLSFAQLGLHQKPIGLLNTDNFFDPLLDLLVKICEEGFMPPENKQLLLVSGNETELIEKMLAYKPVAVASKWLNLNTR